jgi:beta-barrel assembly-enhancing protease
MPRRVALFVLLVAGGAVLFVLQRHKVSTPITPRPLLYLVADGEREAERLPLEVTQVSDQEEMRVGARISMGVCHVQGQNRDAELVKIRAYVSQAGEAVARNVNRHSIHYTFCVDDNPSFVNAYALPGGYVVIGRGLLSILESEDELAFILGHEIAHVDDRHAIERVQYQLASRKLGLESVYQLGAPIQMLYESGYSKEQEQEADRDGINLAYQAGYSAKGALDAMTRFEKIDREMHSAAGSPVEEFASIPFQSLEEYFRSHPPAAERRQALEQIIASHSWNADAPVRPYALHPIFLAEQAAALDKQGKFAKSIERFKAAIALDSTNQRALDGLALAYWRSGDAIAAESAAIAAVQVEPSVPTLRILARAGTVANRADAIQAITAVANQKVPGKSFDQFARVQLDALASTREAAGISGAADYQILLGETAGTPQWQATLRTEMAWWMYRAGNLKDAVAELEAAHQAFPNFGAAVMWKAWVDSDYAHQADAENDLELSINAGMDNNSEFASTQSAARAVISWRTEKKDLAKSQFQAAAAEDEVWMVHNWMGNNFSPATAAILFQLQAAEAARREEARKKREAR